MEKPEQRLNRRALLTLTAAGVLTPQALLADAPGGKPQPFNLHGKFQQSGYCIGRGAPDAELWVDGFQRGRTSDTGWFYVGFDRDSGPTCSLEVRTPTGTDLARVDIAPTRYDIQRIDGLPPETVTPTEPDSLARIKNDAALKNIAFASRDSTDHFRKGFIYPLKTFQVSGHFGNQRVLNGVTKSPHYGFDMAAPTGTLIHAPQAGLVILAEPDLFYEGGLTFIDHGQGVISMYLHQSQLLVKKGDRVYQGQRIGKVGARGRATGPHLCWRLKWGDRRMDPSLMVT